MVFTLEIKNGAYVVNLDEYANVGTRGLIGM